MAEKKAIAEELALRAYLYVSGELTEAERADFEHQLAWEQPAREALAEAVRMSATLVGSSPRPDPAYRDRVRQRLRPTWWRRLLSQRSYYGHPLLWATFGAAAALLVALTVFRPIPGVRIIDRPVFVERPVEPDDSGDEALQDMAFIWADLSTPDHVVKTHTEENLRKSRVEDRRQTRRASQPRSGQ